MTAPAVCHVLLVFCVFFLLAGRSLHKEQDSIPHSICLLRTSSLAAKAAPTSQRPHFPASIISARASRDALI